MNFIIKKLENAYEFVVDNEPVVTHVGRAIIRTNLSDAIIEIKETHKLLKEMADVLKECKKYVNDDINATINELTSKVKDHIE